MISVDALVKSYGNLRAVDGVSFTAESGSIFGFLGPNGAGKSTTINCVSGLLQPDAGSVSILGHDIRANPVEAKRNLGVVPQEVALYDDISAQENLKFWGSAYGLGGKALRASVDEALELVGLADRRKTPPKKMSGGMKRRLNFAAGVIHKPKVLLLDEPTVGVDPQSRARLLDLVRDQASRGACVLYTTHYMEEAQNLCDALAIIDQGRIVAQGTLDDLRAQTGENDLVRLAGSFPETLADLLDEFPDMDIVHQEAEAVSLSFKNGAARLPELLQRLAGAGAEVREATLTRPSLESLFIKLTGRELRD